MNGPQPSRSAALSPQKKWWLKVLIFCFIALIANTAWAQSLTTQAATASHRPPSDAPRLTESAIRLPPAPSGFNRHDAGWVDYAYPPEARQRISKLMEIADATRNELQDKLSAVVLTEVHVRIARTPMEMTTLAPENAPYPRYAAGVAYPDLGLILITLEAEHASQQHDIVETFKHELAHLALHDAVKGHHIPRWFNEGFAVFVSGESSLPRLQTLWTATVSGNLISLERLESSFPDDAITAGVAYAQAADIVRYLVRREDRYRFDALVERLARGQSFDESLRVAYGVDRAALEAEWRDDVSKRYTYWPILSSTGVLWSGILVLFFLAYRRKKNRDRSILERWRNEEAREDARRQLFEEALREAELGPEKRIHIVVASPTPPPIGKAHKSAQTEVDVPKVEHDGNVYTLH